MNDKDITLLVTDLNMSGMDGIELLRRIRKENNSIDCIVMSAYTEEKYLKLSKELGVKEYIVKPFEFLEFLDAIDKL